jgi:hypothetical protein
MTLAPVAQPATPTRAPRYMLDLKSRTALRDVECYYGRVSEHVKNLRRLCPLPEADFFFDHCKKLESNMALLLRESGRILRKIRTPFVDTTYVDPVYEVSGKLQQSHTDFLISFRHLKISKCAIFSRTLFVLANKLETDMDHYIARNRPDRNIQFATRVAKIEPDFRLKLHELHKDLLVMVSPIQFDVMDPVKTTELIEQYKVLNRVFESELYAPIGSNVIDPVPSKSEWHRTFIQFVPLLAHAPLFNQTIQAIDKLEPMLSEAIYRLCSKLNTTAPIDQELSVFQDNITSFDPDRVELILDRASAALDRRRDNTKSKVDQLEELFDGLASLVKDLRADVSEKVKTIARIEKELEHTS